MARRRALAVTLGATLLCGCDTGTIGSPGIGEEAPDGMPAADGSQDPDHPGPEVEVPDQEIIPAGAEFSELWGVEGEEFDPTGRLMDWSYAGYHAGEDEPPQLAPTISVMDYGATADDASDDSEAFIAALDAAVEGDVVGVPAGTFVIKQKLTVKSGVVFQGAGSDQTILSIPVSLTAVYGNSGLASGDNSSYAFSGAFIKASGRDNGEALATVTAPAARGSTRLALSSTTGIRPGDWIQIEQKDVSGTLIKRLHANLMSGGSDNVGDKGMDFYTRVKAVSPNGMDVAIERALPVDVQVRWSPTVKSINPEAREVGVEHLAVRFPETSYAGHLKEKGYNAIQLNKVEDSWVRDVRIVNADYGVNLTDTHFVTVKNVVIETTNGRTGHHALNNSHGSDNLFVDFNLKIKFVHDVTVEWYATGNVVTRGRGKNLAMDHHRAAPYTTLWTQLDCGSGSRPFTSGGSTNRGPHTAAYDTLWNVTASQNMSLPDGNYGPRMSFVGFRTGASRASSSYDWWFEKIAPANLYPPNLWMAMRRRRLGRAAAANDW